MTSDAGESPFVNILADQREGLIPYRSLAGKVLKVRNRPDWLLVSLVVVSVAILEALPVLWSHLFLASNTTSYLTNNVVILVSMVGPTFVMPIFHLEISGRFTWFVRSVMWLSAPITLLPAYALRRLKQRRRSGQQAHMDGLLPLNELIQFILLHERGQGYGGTLNNDVGETIRDLLKGQISGEAANADVETEESWSIQSESVGSSSVQSRHLEGPTAVETRNASRRSSIGLHDQEESTAINIESTSGPTKLRSHGQEGSTAVEDIPASGLRKRGERSTECYEPVAPMVSMQMPEQALVKGSIHASPTLVNNRYMGQGAPNTRRMMPPRRKYPLQNLSNLVTPRRRRLPMMESCRKQRKDSGLVTDSFLLEQG